MDQLSPVATNSNDISDDEVDDIVMEIFGEQSQSSDNHPLISTPNSIPLDNPTSDRYISEFNESASSISSEGEPNAAAATTQTPKSSRCVKNPFEQRVLDSLAGNTCSPNMFQYRKPKRKRLMGFEWTIEQQSLMCPAEIPEDGNAISSDAASPSFEKKADAVLNHYWDNVHYLPSPDPSVVSMNSRRSGDSLFRQLMASSSSRATKTTSSQFLTDDEDDEEDTNKTEEKENRRPASRAGMKRKGA